MSLGDVVNFDSSSSGKTATWLAPPIMIVGMHRSGTSFLTGSLQAAGLELGEYSAWNRHNRKGNRENQDIVAFHDAVLARHGYAWDNPPPGPLSWSDSEVSAARQWMAQYAGEQHWGFKDPRSLLLVEGWLELVPNMRFVGIFRHPRPVFRSLYARSKTTTEEGAFRLWKAYNTKLLDLHEHYDFPLLCFDEQEHTLHEKLNAVCGELGLGTLPEERFFSEDLKHHKARGDGIPDDLAALYRALRKVAR